MRERKHLSQLGRRLQVGEVHDPVVLGDVLGVGIRDAVAFVRIAIAAIPGVGHALEIPFPGFPRSLELGHQIVGVDRVPRKPVRVVAVDAKEVASEHGDVIRFARVGNAPVVRGQTVILRQGIQDRCVSVADDLVVVLVFHDEQENVVILRERLRVERRAGCDKGQTGRHHTAHEAHEQTFF